jgi:glycosyltransferase involved in cell wall biosynthesis
MSVPRRKAQYCARRKSHFSNTDLNIRSMRILVVMPLAERRGGAELALLHLLEHGRPGWSWHVTFLEEGPMVGQASSAGATVDLVRAGRVRQPRRLRAAVRKLAAIAREREVDVMFGWMAKAQLYCGPAAARAGLPALWYQHGVPSRASWIDRLATAFPARGILACSKSAAAAQQRLFPHRPVRVVYPGVDLDHFSPDSVPTSEEARARLGLPGTGPLVGMFGRLQRWKGFHVLLEAMPRILEQRPDAFCVLVGGVHALEPDYRRLLERRVVDLGLEQRVRFVGLQADVSEWMQAMDVVVHASSQEPWGLVILEAMALGKPVVASDSGGPAEIITSGVNGLLVPPGNSRQLAGAILRYLGDATFAARVCAAGRVRARDFSTEAYAESFERAVDDILAGRDDDG